MATDSTDLITLSLTPSEAMTVLAAVRQYEPYWGGNDDVHAVAVKLSAIRTDIHAVLGKIRQAARDS